MARRPFSAYGVRFTAPSGVLVGGGSVADIVRADQLAFLYCDHCNPPYKIARIDFREWPWTRYLNYPAQSGFVCNACGHPMIMHTHSRSALAGRTSG
jgi:hypothetical protein